MDLAKLLRRDDYDLVGRDTRQEFFNGYEEARPELSVIAVKDVAVKCCEPREAPSPGRRPFIEKCRQAPTVPALAVCVWMMSGF